jgi:hypothetical protein
MPIVMQEIEAKLVISNASKAIMIASMPPL